MPSQFGQPPRVTGRPEADLAATVDWLWSFYQAAILEAGLIQNGQLADLIETQFPLLFALENLEGRAADTFAYFSGEDTWAITSLSAFSRTVLDDASAPAWQSTLGITGVVTDAELLAIAGLVSVADGLPYFTGLGTASLTTLSSFARTLLDDTTEAQARTTLGLGTVIPLPSYTVAGVPAAATWTAGLIYVSNEAGGAVPAFSDGVNWRRVTDRAIIS